MWDNCTSDAPRPCDTYSPAPDAVKFRASRLKPKEYVPTATNCEAVEKSVRSAIVRERMRRVVENRLREQKEQEAAQHANREAFKRSVRNAIEREQKRRVEAERLREQEDARCAEAEARRAVDEAAAYQARLLQRDEAAKLARVVQEEAEQREQEVQANIDIVKEFLRDNGYDHVNFKRTKGFMYKFPLHTAVKQRKAEMVRRLLRCGADPALTNSAGKTPRHVAEAMTRPFSELADILSALPAP